LNPKNAFSAQNLSGECKANAASLEQLRPILQPTIEMLEFKRNRILDKLRNASLVGLVIFGLTCTLLYRLTNVIGFEPLYYFGALLLGLAPGLWVFGQHVPDYRNTFKSLVIPPVIDAVSNTLNCQLSYSPTSGISQDEFQISGLFCDPDRYKSEDLVEGQIGHTKVRFSAVHAVKQVRPGSRKGSEGTYEPIFKGLLFAADFNKEFSGTTLVTPDTTKRDLNKLGQKLQEWEERLAFTYRERITLEDPEFEKAFAVYSGDQIKARYLLSTSLMRRLLDFRAKCNSDFHLAFTANHIYLAFSMKQDWLEAPAVLEPVTFDLLSQYTTQLHFALGIIEDLDLNTRIWSKG
jgi:hypothetical protein